MAEFDYRDGIATGQLLLQRCAACGTIREVPGPMCGTCHSLDWDTVVSTGRGTVGAWIVNERSSASPKPILAMVTIDEGVTFTVTLRGVTAATVRNDMPVVARIVDDDGVSVLVFEPPDG
jgi:uncharacterized OB-fold protein